MSYSEILAMSVSERIQLAQDIWDSIAAVPETLTLTEKQQQELSRRMESYRQHPQKGESWATVKDKLGKLLK